MLGRTFRSARRGGVPNATRPSWRAFTLVEIVLAVALLGVGLAAATAWGALDRLGLSWSARLAEAQLARARLRAVALRHPVRVALRAGHRLELSDAGGAVISVVDLGGSGLRALDSVRIRPDTIRYNPRGHGAAGSLYLYRGRRGIRLVSNFIGRVRRQSFGF